MCGIFFITQEARDYDNDSINKIKQAFSSGEGRGPDNSVFIHNFSEQINYYLPENKQQYFHVGFHRLSINGLDEESNQPLIVDRVGLICNGEIYNYKDLYTEHNIVPQTNSDCEVIIHLYLKYGIAKTLQLLHGVFAFVIIDDRNRKLSFEESLDKYHALSYNRLVHNEHFYDRTVIVARDAYGIRPMFITENENNTFGVSSLLKQLEPLTDSKIKQFEPGTYKQFFYNDGSMIANAHYNFKYDLLFSKGNSLNSDNMLATCFNVNKYLNEAVKMRVDNTDRPVACLLSGGLDSSLITALVAKYVPDPKQLNTFSIGMDGASDLSYARQVAEHLGTNHHEIIVSEDDFFEAIPLVIKAIESYDTTTVRASVGNYLIGRYISENCDAKVIFNGDGSDELFGGYLYMHCAPNSDEFDSETKRLLDNIHYFDVLRSDRCISCHGLEPRTPFMDVNLIAYYLTVSRDIRNHSSNENKASKLPEKYILRKAFSHDNLLPSSVLWRTKEAFSDGVSNEDNSWHTIIKRRLESHKKDIMESPGYTSALSLEQNYYKQIFDMCYSGNDNVIPYYWMPKFTDATDCSARSLGIYKELQ